mgnify:CR=1 FL=1
MNYNTQQRISPQDPEWRKIYNGCFTQQGHFRQSSPKRQTKIYAECKGQKKKLRIVIEHNSQDLTLTAP